VKHGISSQEELGQLAGLHRTYIGRLERGETGVSVETLARVLAAIGVSLEDFFRGWEPPLAVGLDASEAAER
jgi:transcriptional regulator with XRE-family HTH domain